MSKVKIWLLLLILTAFHSAEYSQQQISVDHNSQVIRIPTDLVTFDAQVLNKNTWHPVVNLSMKDFVLSEEGKRQNLSHFGFGVRQLSIVLLIDISGSALPYYTQIQEAGLLSLKDLSPGDEVALMAFNSGAALIHGFTKDKQKIVEKMANLENVWNTLGANHPNPNADGTLIGDSLYTASEYLRTNASAENRRVIITVTDNMAEGARAIYSRGDVLHKLLESDVLVYGLTIETPYTRNTNKGITKIGDYHPVVIIFRQAMKKRAGGKVDYHAEHTGGLTLAAESINLSEQLVSLMKLLRHRYSFGYASLNSTMDGKFRNIKLKVTPEVEKREGGVIILAKQGYYARPRNTDKPTAGASAAPKKN